MHSYLVIVTRIMFPQMSIKSSKKNLSASYFIKTFFVLVSIPLCDQELYFKNFLFEEERGRLILHKRIFNKKKI